MHKLLNTYRSVAVITGLLILVGITLPAGLHAGNLITGHCEIPEHTAPAAHDDCGMNGLSHHQTSHSEHQRNNDSTGCKTELACGCSAGTIPARTQAVQSSSKTGPGLSPAALDLTEDIRRPPVYAGYSIDTAVHEASPPLFLLNSSFLN